MSERTLKIAFAGAARSGKDTAAAYLIARYGGMSISFAKPLYDILHFAQSTCGFPLQKDRTFLQYVGTEWARTQDPDVWVRLAREKIQTNFTSNIYFTDARYENEVKELQELGFLIVKIDRPADLRDDIGGGSATHLSETALANFMGWDAVIRNDGSLETFYMHLDRMVQEMC